MAPEGWEEEVILAGTPSGVTVERSPTPGHIILRHCLAAALNAVEPTRAMERALERLTISDQPVALVCAGKAARGMAQGLVDWLTRAGREPMTGLVIVPEPANSPHPALTVLTGNHPVPGAQSCSAGDHLSAWVNSLPLDVSVHVAISGGASALLAAPLPGLSMADVTRTFELLLASGLDIEQSNAIRKRVAHWTAGRLALALHPRPITVWLLSDVPGDDPEVIGSGPCHGDRWSARDVVALCREKQLLESLPSAVIAALEFDTPKPSHPGATAERTTIVASNRVAMEAAKDCAIALGCHAKLMAKPLSGEARVAGEQIAHALLRVHGSRFGTEDTLGDSARPRVFVYGGETTVALEAGHGEGGRNQELALAAARVLADQRPGVTLLAAGTDGRDGPTDAAGAMVDPTTWGAIMARHLNPVSALAQHDSHRALDAVGALLRTGMSGTNVMDLVLACYQPSA
jgi:glycerate 2-kinase